MPCSRVNLILIGLRVYASHLSWFIAAATIAADSMRFARRNAWLTAAILADMIGSVILMCAGRAERWGRHLGVHKHLIQIDGEPLLDRTLRLVRRHTPDVPVIIVAFDPQYARDGCERFEPAHGPIDFCDTDKFLSAE